jgi:hypothetical protein
LLPSFSNTLTSHLSAHACLLLSGGCDRDDKTLLRSRPCQPRPIPIPSAPHVNLCSLDSPINNSQLTGLPRHRCIFRRHQLPADPCNFQPSHCCSAFQPSPCPAHRHPGRRSPILAINVFSSASPPPAPIQRPRPSSILYTPIAYQLSTIGITSNRICFLAQWPHHDREIDGSARTTHEREINSQISKYHEYHSEARAPSDTLPAVLFVVTDKKG